MDLTERISQESLATRLSVGCVIVKKKNIISFGWNGTISGWPSNEPEEEIIVNENGIFKTKIITKPETIHAESNSIAKLAREGHSAKGDSLFCNYLPCQNCASLIVNCGIKAVYYKHLYRDISSIEFFKTCNVKIIQVL